MKLSITRLTELSNQLRYFDKAIQDPTLTDAERDAANNFRLCVCDLLGVFQQINGRYMKSIKSTERTEQKFD